MNKTKREDLENAVEEGLDYCQKKSDDLAISYIQDHVVPRLRIALEDVLEDIQSYHMLDSDNNKGNFVVHYTSIDALLCMLENSSKGKTHSSLRLYDSMHLNDPDEGNYFDRNLNLPEKHSWLNRKRRSHAYIASFIIPDVQKDMSDNLAFWRAYGREGEGCSLLLHISLFQLRKVIYGSDKVKRAERKIIPVLDVVEPLIASSGLRKKEIGENLAEVVWRSLEEIRYLYKSEAYDYERECRFVIPESSIDTNEIYFERHDQKETASIIRHYCEDESLKIRRLLVTNSSITLGPRVSNADNIRYYLETLLKRQELFGTKIKVSKIPYRKF